MLQSAREVEPCGPGAGDSHLFHLVSDPDTIVRDTSRSVVGVFGHAATSKIPPLRLGGKLLGSSRTRAMVELLTHGQLRSDDLLELRALQADPSFRNMRGALAGLGQGKVDVINHPVLLRVPGSDASIVAPIDCVVQYPGVSTLLHIAWCKSETSSSKVSMDLHAWIRRANALTAENIAEQWDSIGAFPASLFANECLAANIESYAFRRELERVEQPLPKALDVAVVFADAENPRGTICHLADAKRSLIFADHVIAFILLQTTNTTAICQAVASLHGVPRRLESFGWTIPSELKQLQKFIEVLVPDSTNSTNSFHMPVYQVCGVTSDGHTVTGARIAISNETQATMTRLWRIDIPFLLSPIVTQAVHSIVCDDQRQQIRAIDSARDPRANSLNVGLTRFSCVWHKIELYCANHFKRLFFDAGDYDRFMNLFRQAYKVANCDREVDDLITAMHELIDPESTADLVVSEDSIATIASYIDSMVGPDERKTWCRPARIRSRTLAISTSGTVEADNGNLKGGRRKVISAQTLPGDLVRRSIEVAAQRVNRDVVVRARRRGSRRLRTDSRLHAAEDALTPFAYRLFSEQFHLALNCTLETRQLGVWAVRTPEKGPADISESPSFPSSSVPSSGGKVAATSALEDDGHIGFFSSVSSSSSSSSSGFSASSNAAAASSFMIMDDDATIGIRR